MKAQQLFSQYLDVVALSLAVGRKYLQSNSSGSGEENFHVAQQEQQSPAGRLSLSLALATFAFAALLTAIRQFFLGFFCCRRRERTCSFFTLFKWTSLWSIKEGGRERLGEALYSLLSYSGSFSLAAALVHRNGLMSGNLDAFWAHDTSFAASSLVTLLYAYECAHYLSSLVVVLLFKTFNRWYSALLTLHHLVALVLLVLSFQSSSLLHIGVAVLYLHDLCDILLQLTKVLNQLQENATTAEEERGYCRPSTVIKLLRMVVFGAFTATWFAARLYAFPVLVIGSCGRRLMALKVSEWPPGGFILYALLQLIALMNAYWAGLILGIAVRCALRGAGAEAIEDVREEKVKVKVLMIKENVTEEERSKKIL